MSAPRLNRLVLSNIRNLGSVDLNFGPQFNVFIGPNGSGKTSLLEAIYLLGIGRSFRARSSRQIIKFGAHSCVIRAQISPETAQAAIDQPELWLAVERSIDGAVQYKIGAQEERSVAELTKMLPVQLIDVNSHLLLEGGPNYRREFMDWGVFHVEHAFLDDWRAMKRALEQRNQALKQKQMPDQAWNVAFVKYACAVDTARKAYIDQFAVTFMAMLQQMLGIDTAELKYKRGWPEAQDLRIALEQSSHLDFLYGYTHYGPQRAELEITIAGKPAKEVLSRGQIKIFVCIMLLARAKLLRNEQKSLFLIDDLHAELDKRHCSLFIEAIKAMQCQVFITGIEADLLRDRLQACTTQMFHVERGMIREWQEYEYEC
jgi:DNA replication and repair protein RecF